MNVPLRLRLLQRLTDYLRAEVTIARGYHNDLTGNVWRGRMFFDQDDTVPMVSILENTDPDRFSPQAGAGGPEHPHLLNRLSLLVQGWAGEDKQHPTDPAYYLMADVQKALARIAHRGDPRGALPDDVDEVFMLGGELINITIEPGVVRPAAEQVSDTAFFWMRVNLHFDENVNDPYA